MKQTVWGLAALAAAALALAGCETGRDAASQVQVPFTSTNVAVQSAARLGFFWDMVIVGDSFSGRLYFPVRPECDRFMVEGKAVEYRRTGAWGEIRDAQGFCQPIGIGGLAQWRDRNYRNPRRDRSRARAQYTIMEKGPEFALARGNFPLANLMGFRGDDVVAVIMNDDACAPPLSRDVSTMEFRTRGSYALMLLSDAGSCAIDGLVIPQ